MISFTGLKNSVMSKSPDRQTSAAAGATMDIGSPTNAKHVIKVTKGEDGKLTGFDGLPEDMMKLMKVIPH